MKTQKAQEGNWLYQDQSEDYRYFTKEIYLPDDAKLWAECTDEEKKQWEEEHKPEPGPEPADTGGNTGGSEEIR